MPSSSSTSGLSAAALATLSVLSACAAGLDFDSLSNACQPPSFDLEGYDLFCSGRLEQGGLYQPPEMFWPGAATAFQHAVITEDGAIFGALLYGVDSNGCGYGSLGLSAARFAPEGGGLEHAASFLGIDDARGIAWLAQSAGGQCPDVEPVSAWVSDIAVLREEPLELILAAAQGGVLYVAFDDQYDVSRYFHLPGVPWGNQLDQGPRKCVAGACVASEGSYCRGDAACAPDSYCSADQVCTQRPECSSVCPQSTSCGALTLCTPDCRTSADCPYPLQCRNGLCGGLTTCSSDASIPSRECPGRTLCNPDLGGCLEPCFLLGENACDEGRFCIPQNQTAGICGPPTTIGPCERDSDCTTAFALGATAFRLPSLGEEVAVFAIAEAWEGLRIGIAWPSSVYLPPKSSSIDVCTLLGRGDGCETGSVATDVVFWEGSLYVAIALGEEQGVAIVDLRGVSEQGELHPSDLRFQSASSTVPLVQLFVVDGYLVGLEGGPLFSGVESHLHVWALNPDNRDFLTELADIALGQTSWVTVATLQSNPAMWAIGAARTVSGADGELALDRGSDVLFYDMSRLSTDGARLVGQQHLVVEGIDSQTTFPLFDSGRFYVGHLEGVTELHLSVEGAPL